MIGALRGRLITKGTVEVIVEAAGVGYLVSVPTGTLAELPETGRDVFLHVHTCVRDDAIQLYGFASEGEKRVFMMLLGVTGIGPKVALNIVSGIGYEELMRAIDAEDIGLLTKVPGLGKKTASRLVLELRGKLPKGDVRPPDPVYEDALSALLNFGYRKAEAEACLDTARKRGVEGLETLIKEALKCLTGARGEAG